MRNSFALACSVLFLCTQQALLSQERITFFESDITVLSDATLTVKETITVFSTGESIVHGIVREFPTRYKDHLGTNYEVGFRFEGASCDGRPVHYTTEKAPNGKKIYLGEKYATISKGMHTYTLIYTTNRQLGFFPKHDELYWNVTGNGWRLPIDKVRATVYLPKHVAPQSMWGYTGLQGEQGSDYASVVDHNCVTFSSTRSFHRGEGFTIVVAWPKGFVSEPSYFQSLVWFFQDNWTFFILILGLLALLFLAVRCWFVAHHANAPGTIIPRFYPPEGMTPSVVGYMKNMQWSKSLFPADLVNLAIRGFITIEHKKTFWRGNQYTLSRSEKSSNDEELHEYERELLKKMFSKKTTISIDSSNRDDIAAAQSKVERFCYKKVKNYLTEQGFFLYASIGIFLSMVIIFILAPSIGFLFLGLLVIPLAIIYKHFSIYTKKGREVQDEIDGFEMYLVTAEIERMKVIGTPPTKTPELYEKYLPYAIALGVEEQWNRQFITVFERLERQGNPYDPYWHSGHFSGMDTFTSQFGSSFNNAVSSAASPSGSSSGSSGNGSSGGGGGGGGGGGW